MTQSSQDKHYIVLGAGPAGLMAAWELVKAGCKVTILERDNKVGGMCATLKFQGKHGDYRFDYGGHRFITRNPELLKFVDQLMGDELLYAERKSVIRFKDRIYQYPLAIGDLLKNAPFSLLFGTAVDLMLMPFKSKPQNRRDSNFAEWIESRFGKTLYQHFFAGYTEKLWGISPRILSGDWASQRISLLDLKDVAKRLLPQKKDTPRTYAKKYRYPKWGFGHLYDRLAQVLEKQGVDIRLNCDISDIVTSDNQITGIQYTADGTTISLNADYVISTIPLSDMCRMTGFDSKLKFRSLRFFDMPMQRENISDNTWQYLSDPEILGTRLQEPRRRSPFMSPKGHTSVMIEIPCNKGDEIWDMPGEQLKTRVDQDLERLGVKPEWSTGEFFSAYTEHAYPLMDLDYQQKRERAIEHLYQFENLVMSGRQGTFRYIFTDTAMEMGQLAAQSLLNGEDRRREIFDFRNENVVLEVESVA